MGQVFIGTKKRRIAGAGKSRELNIANRKTQAAMQLDRRPLRFWASCTDCTAPALSFLHWTDPWRSEIERASEHDFVKIMQKINYRAKITKSLRLRLPLNEAGMDGGNWNREWVTSEKKSFAFRPKCIFSNGNYNPPGRKNAQEIGTLNTSITSNMINQTRGLSKW